jgi:PAS domain S-box-containing protein
VRALDGETVRDETVFITVAEGPEHAFAGSCSPIRTGGQIVGAVTVAHDVTARREADAAIARLASFPELNPNPIIETDLAGTVTYANPSAARLLPDLAALKHDHPWLTGLDAVVRILCTEQAQTVERDVTLGDRWFHQTMNLVGDAERVRIYANEVTDSKRTERELRRLNRTLKALHSSAQLMVLAASEEDYLRSICDIIIQDCGHAMVWIGYANDDAGKTVRPAASAGFDEGYLDTLDITWADTERGRGPTGSAIRTGQPYPCRNMVTDPAFAPWRAEALKRGYASSVAIPLIAAGATIGAITIYSRECDPFSDDEISLLVQLAGDLAFGIHALRMRTARDEAEHALEQSEERYRALVEMSPEAILVHRNDIITYANSAAVDLCGATMPRQLLGRSVFEIFHPDCHEVLRDRIDAVQNGITVPLIAEKIVRMDGTIRDVEAVASLCSSIEGPGHQVILRDITDRKKAEDQLRLQLTVLQSTASAIVITDTDATIQWVNGAFVWLTGYTSAEAVGQNPRILKSGLQDGEFYRAMWDTILDGRVWRGELVNKRKNGTLYTEEMTLTPVKDTSGQVTHFVAIKQDISERKIAEAQLAEQRALLTAVIDSSDGPVFSVDREYRYTSFNQPHAALMKALFDADIEIGKSVLDYHRDQEARDTAKANIDVALRGLSLTVEAYLGGDGEDDSRFYSISHNPVRNASGEVTGAAVFSKDLTERKRAEEAVLESERRFRIALRNSPVTVAAQDRDLRYTWLYSSTIDDLATELIGKTDRDIYALDEAARITALKTRAVETGTDVSASIWLSVAGARRFFDVFIEPVRDDAGAVVGIMSAAVDLTDMKVAEAKVSYQAVLEERNRFAQDIHDTLAQGFTGIVVQLEAAEDALAIAPEQAQAHIVRARDLARESLQEARRSVRALRPQALERGTLTEALANMAKRMGATVPVRVVFQSAGDSRPLSADTEEALFRIGQEAITNAIKHAEANEIRVDLIYDATRVLLTVKDDGKGFDIDAAVRGEGFGLFGMHDRAARIGAELTVTCSPGPGTCITVAAPMMFPQSEENC